jgi:Fic-DOC domain mobile mystery protein B
MGLVFDYGDGQTPIDEEEKNGLLLKAISTKSELDEWEQSNIEDAIIWSLTRKFKLEQVLTESFVKLVHQKMFSRVWDWAGEFRQSNKNMGVDRWQIGIEVKKLLDDVIFWKVNSVYPPDGIIIRFKHKLVTIHCFANGNGRHSRLMADIMAEQLFGLPVFTWGINLTNARLDYLKALKFADAGDYDALLAFARG